MKNLLSTIMCGLLVILSSCEKPVLAEQETNDQPTEGNLTVSVYKIEQTPFADFTRTSASEVCTRLNFAIYNADGKRIKQTDQTSSMANFGHASFQLSEGTYQIVVVAQSSGGNPTMTDPTKIQFTNAKGYSDTFLYSDEVTVTGEKQEIRASLNRIVSLCRLVITDDIPANVKKMQFYYTGGSGAFDAYTGLGSVKSKQTVTYNVTEGNNQFDLYTFLHDTEGTIQLKVTALDASDNVLYERDLSVPMVKNKITWLSGAFFNGSDSQDNTISIDINTEWDGEIHITF